jgi:predicted DNA-binding transcriptional regulator AlpA
MGKPELKKSNGNTIMPRLMRMRDAPAYLGMDKNRFNSSVRPYLTEIPLGKQVIAFDRLEIDAWVDHYIGCYGRPGQPNGGITWDRKKHRAFSNAQASGISINASTDGAFARALEALSSAKQSAT